MHAKGTKQVREAAPVSDCTKGSCVRKVGERRIRKLSVYEVFWIYSKMLTSRYKTATPGFRKTGITLQLQKYFQNGLQQTKLWLSANMILCPTHFRQNTPTCIRHLYSSDIIIKAHRRACKYNYPGQKKKKKRTFLEICGEKNAVPRVISCSIMSDQRRAKGMVRPATVRDFCPALIARD